MRRGGLTLLIGLLLAAGPPRRTDAHNGESPTSGPVPIPTLPTPSPRGPQSPDPTGGAPTTPGSRTRGTAALPSRPMEVDDWWELARDAWVPVSAQALVTTATEGASAPGRSLEEATDREVVPVLRWAVDPASALTSAEVAPAYLALGRLTRRAEDVLLLVRAGGDREATLIETESALLALGLLPRSDPAREAPADALARALRACLAALDDDRLPARARALGALGAGWLGAEAATPEDPFSADLFARLGGERRASDEVPTALLQALAAFPARAHGDAVAKALHRCAWVGGVGQARLGSLGQAHAALAFAQVAEPPHPGPLLGIALSTRPPEDVRICAVVGLGAASASFLPAGRVDAARRLAALPRVPPAMVGPVLVATARTLRADFAAGPSGAVLACGAAQTLRDALDGPRPADRAWAALALGLALRRSPEAEGLRAFHEARRGATGDLLARARAASGSTEERATAMLALGLLQAEEAADDLTAAARDESAAPLLRGRACEALGLLGRRRGEARDVLRAVALDEGATPWLRVRAAEALARLDDTGLLVRALAKELAGAATDRRLVVAAAALGRSRSLDAVQPLVRRLRDPATSAWVRAGVVMALADLCDPEPVPRQARLADVLGQTPRSDALDFLVRYR